MKEKNLMSLSINSNKYSIFVVFNDLMKTYE